MSQMTTTTTDVNPEKYMLTKTMSSPCKKYTLAWLVFQKPNQKLFTEDKILLMKIGLGEFLDLTKVLPTFNNDYQEVELIGEFRPTVDGWSAAKKYIKMLGPG